MMMIGDDDDDDDDDEEPSGGARCERGREAKDHAGPTSCSNDDYRSPGRD